MLIGERIRLRSIDRSDLPLFVGWLNDPEVRAGLALVVPLSLSSEENWFNEMIKQPPDEHPLTIEVRSEDGWRPIGNISFHQIDRRSRNTEIGIFIGDKSLWNQGYGGEAMRLMLDYGFNTLNLHRIWLRVHSTNPRAIRSYEKVGFVPEGRLRQSEFQAGHYIDMLIMSVLRPEWEQRAGNQGG